MKDTSEPSPDEIPIKIMVIGNTAVGKTSFILKYTEDTFQEVHLSTVGVDFRIKHITYNNKKYKLSIYDTTGQERYKALAFSLIKNVDGIILIYDVTDISTFKSVPDWIQSAREKKGENYPMIILGNKIDLKEKRQIKEEEGKNFAENKRMAFFEISVKTGENLDNLTLFIIKKIFNLPDDFSGEIIVRKKNINEKKKDEEICVEKFCCFYSCL